MASETKWTPGPWHVEPDEGYGYHPRVHGVDRLIAEVGNMQTDEWERHFADAHLIAAAPDLYAALEAARKVIHQIVLAATEENTIDTESGDDKWFAEHGSEAIDKIDAALSAAKPSEGSKS